jgi:NMD protein affecting ribosome stability and mRNA decay
MDKLYEKSETGCCPRFDPAPWEDKEVTFTDKLSVKDRVRSFLHIPLNFGSVMVKTHVASKKKQMRKLYFFYTTCPKCAKFYGKNYTVLLAQI